MYTYYQIHSIRIHIKYTNIVDLEVDATSWRVSRNIVFISSSQFAGDQWSMPHEK